MRQDVAHVLVLITDGRAQDNVVPPSRIARALGPYEFLTLNLPKCLIKCHLSIIIF